MQNAIREGKHALFWALSRQMRGNISRAAQASGFLDGEDRLIVEPLQYLQLWRDYYVRLGNAQDDADEKIRTAEPFDGSFRDVVTRKLEQLVAKRNEMPELDGPISREEVDTALAAARNRSAAGPDLVPPMLLKSQGDDAREALRHLFDRVWESGQSIGSGNLGSGRPNGEKASSWRS
jgi:hypothetical protein